ncbi:unnamed protein product [Aphanomyces euteiches]
MSGRGEKFGSSDSFLKLKRKQQAINPEGGPGVGRDGRSNLSIKLVQDQLKAESAALAIPTADPVPEFVDYIASKIKGQDAWIEFFRVQATIFRLEKGGGLNSHHPAFQRRRPLRDPLC